MSFHYDKAVELIEKARSNGRLAHAYLVTGPPGSGKERLCIHMVGMVNPEVAAAKPDTVEGLRSSTTAVIGPESKSRRITVKAVRDIEHTLQMAAPAGVTKFAIIRDADRMNPESENAFLKTLEEPPASSRLVLLTSRPEMLLDTVLSRCIRISLAGKRGATEIPEAAREFLKELKKHSLNGRGGVSGALGLMAKFSSILKEEKAQIAKRNEESQKEEVAHYRNKTEGDYLKRREEYFKALTEAEYLQQRNRLVEYLVMWFGDAMRQQAGSDHLDLPDFAEATAKLAQDLSLDELGERVEAVESLQSNLNTNVFEALALEVGFIRAFA